MQKQQQIASAGANRDRSRLYRSFYAWATLAAQSANEFAQAHFLQKMKLHSQVLVLYFNAWSRQTWSDAVERGVIAKVKASEHFAAEEQLPGSLPEQLPGEELR